MSKVFIYADNAATTRLAPAALESMLPFLGNEFGNASSLHALGRSARVALRQARETIAECIGALPEEIIFTSGGTEGNNWVIKGAMRRGKVIVSGIEHHSVLNSLNFSNYFHSSGCSRRIAVDKQGVFSLRGLESSISHRVSLVSVMLANNEIGTIEPIREVAAIAHRYGAACHTDAVQAVGHIPVQVKDLQVDFLTASAHKFNGPKGIGFVYAREHSSLDTFMHGGQQEFGVRGGTENVAAIVGMAAALRLSCEQMNETANRLNKMVSAFQSLITAAIPEAAFNGDPNNRLPGFISLAIPGISGEALLHYLDLKGIAVSTGAACNSKVTGISHVLRAMRISQKNALGTIRISFGRDNRDDDYLAVAQNIIDYCNKVKSR